MNRAASSSAPGMGAMSAPLCEAWYVVQTKPKQELRAREHLERQGFRCLLPVFRVEKLRRRTRQWVEEPLFSRYLFIQPGADGARWDGLRSTRGVSRLVEFGGTPARLSATWIATFLARGKRAVPLFENGQRVVVTDGPFMGLDGIYLLPDGESRATILLELLGKSCKATFPVESLRRAV